MRRDLLILAALLGAIGCSRDEAPVPTAGPEIPPPNATAAASAAPLGAVALPEAQACVRKCIDDNQMRAESPERIASDCKKQCADSCMKHCAKPGMPDGFQARCEQDCRARAAGAPSRP